MVSEQTLVNEGEALLNQAVRSRKISLTGEKAFIAAVDPFHDKPIDGLRGWPDLETQPSVIRHWKQSYTIPAREAGGAILVHHYPILNNMGLHQFSRRNGIIDQLTVGDTDGQIAPVMVYSYTATQAQFSTLPVSTSVINTYPFAVPDDYFEDGPCRLVGLGIEIRDVTAELYQQGTISCYEVPQPTANQQMYIVRAQSINIGSATIAYAQTPVDVQLLMRPPGNLLELMTYPGSTQWAAKDGAYIVVPFGGHENPPLMAEYRSPVVQQVTQGVSPYDPPNQLNIGTGYIGDFDRSSVNGDNIPFYSNCYTPTRSRGALITGLNAQSTFTITVSYYLETFPVGESPLIPLAAPSCPFDPKALAAMSMAMQQMPVAVPICENPFGEWFFDTVESILPVLSTVASAVFPEFAPLIGGASSLAGDALKTRRKKKNPERKNELKKIVRQDVQKDLKQRAALKEYKKEVRKEVKQETKAIAGRAVKDALKY